ncbi:MAG: anthranilate phosphoribosyltransferase [Niastella sp.]|nr:anthranilate phosphoribosyltransferase [Niastella sp.]
MKAALAQLFRHEPLEEEQAEKILLSILEGTLASASVASFLTVYNMRPPTQPEFKGFVNAMKQCSRPINLQTENAVDIVGTGGDGKNTFNISTLSAVVVAAAGTRVIKHGNYSASSTCGSSNVLEYLGYKFTADEAELNRQLEEENICFLHAPLFHPLMAKVKQVRSDIGLQTIFNLMGPLVNPASPPNLVLGISQHVYLKKFEFLLQELEKNYLLLHSMDGYDEISLTGNFKIITPQQTQLLYPEAIGFKTLQPEQLEVGDSIASAAKIFSSVLNNEATEAQKNVVIVNSAFALQCCNPTKSLEECIALAAEALKNGKALQIFKKLINA